MEDNKELELGAQEEETKTYSEEEVALLIQKEADRRVSQALKTQKEKFEKKMTEAEKLREMDESERENYKLKQKIEELEEANKNFKIAENKAQLAQSLGERGIPVLFCDYLVQEDAEEMFNSLQKLEQVWNAAVNDAASKKISGRTPQASNTTQVGLTKEAFRKMTLSQQNELYQTNRQLYLELSKK